MSLEKALKQILSGLNMENKYPSNWPKWFYEVVKKLKPEIQSKLIIYGRTGKI